MRLIRLFIRNHLMLQNLDLRFDRPGRLDVGNYALDFLVGLNGSGKSTILRVLTQIISDLRGSRFSEFDYILEYYLSSQGEPVRVQVGQEREEEKPNLRMTVWSSGSETPLYDAEAIDSRFLPSQVIVYTTGNENEWKKLIEKITDDQELSNAPENLLADPIERSIVELPGHLRRKTIIVDEGVAPFLLLRSSRLPAITLCGILAHLASAQESDPKPLYEVITALGLEHFRGFSLRFRLHTQLSPFETFEKLLPLATRHIQQGTDQLLVFDLSENPHALPVQILETFGGSLLLFRELDALYNPSQAGESTLQQVNLFLERKNPERAEDTDEDDGAYITRLFLLDWLSDGEQSFLGRMALLSMLDTEDSLILLDEPEVHFNDYWKREIVNLLDVVMREHSNHLLITTHSSILLSDVTEGHISSLTKNTQGYTEQIEFTSPTFGVDPSKIMVHIFDTGSAVGSYSTKYLAEALDRNDPNELRQLLEQTGMGYWHLRILNRLEE